MENEVLMSIPSYLAKKRGIYPCLGTGTIIYPSAN